MSAAFSRAGTASPAGILGAPMESPRGGPDRDKVVVQSVSRHHWRVSATLTNWPHMGEGRIAAERRGRLFRLRQPPPTRLARRIVHHYPLQGATCTGPSSPVACRGPPAAGHCNPHRSIVTRAAAGRGDTLTIAPEEMPSLQRWAARRRRGLALSDVVRWGRFRCEGRFGTLRRAFAPLLQRPAKRADAVHAELRAPPPTSLESATNLSSRPGRLPLRP